MSETKNCQRLLLLDDEAGYRRLLAGNLRDEGYEVLEASNLAAARSILQKGGIELALVDYELEAEPDKIKHFGTELFQAPAHPLPPVVMITNKVGLSEAANAGKLGVGDFLDKRDSNERILAVIQSQLHVGKLLHDQMDQFPMKGSSALMARLRERTLRWAATGANALIVGETGSGKEAVARSLHYDSLTRFKSFIVMNCPGLTETLVESELFGHVKGAYSQAYTDREGACELAREGTLYLAEVGDLPQTIQAKLLNVLSSGEAKRLGSNKPYATKFRLVGATNRNPQEVLRPDFYYRLAETVLEVPPLRDRREDVPEIVEYWMDRLRRETRFNRNITPAAVNYLVKADWPGNVKDLVNFLRELLAYGNPGEPIEAEEVRRKLSCEVCKDRDPFDPSLTYAEAQICFDRELITRRLALSNGVKREAAKSMGIGPTAFYEKLKRCGLSLLVVLAVFFMINRGFASPPLQQAWDHTWKGHYPEAVQEYRTFAKAHPDDPQAAAALYNAANISLSQMAQKETAGKLFAELLNKYPDTRWAAESGRQLSVLALKEKHSDEAAKYFRQALKSAQSGDYQMPETWIAGLAEGWRDHADSLHDPGLTAQMYREVLQVMPKGESAAQTQSDLAGLLKLAGQESEAAAALAEMMTSYPHTRWAAQALKEEHDLVSRHQADFPWEDVQSMNQAAAQMRSGDYSAADSTYTRIAGQYGDKPLGENASFGKIGAALYLSGDFQAAMEQLRDYAARYPKGYRWKDVQRRLDAWGDLARMEASLKEDPRDYTTLCSAGTTMYWMRFYRQAENHFRQATAVDSTIGYAWFMLGEVCNTRGEVQSAVEAYRKYLGVEPTGPYAAPAQAAVDTLSTK